MILDKYIALDSVNIEVTYDMTFMPDSTKRNTAETQRYVSQVGPSISRFFNAYYSEKLNTEERKQTYKYKCLKNVDLSCYNKTSY